MLGADYIRLVLSRWRSVLALVVGCTLAAWLFTVFVLAQNPKFEAAARLNIVPTSEELGYANRFVRGSTFDGGSALVQTYAEFARTRPVVTPIVDRFVAEQAAVQGVSEQDWIAANSVPPIFSPSRIVSILNYGAAPIIPLRQDIVDSLIEHTTIETIEGTYLIRISVEWDDPKAAAWFANALSDAIIARADRMSQKSGTEIAGSLESRLADKQTELATVLRRSRDMKASVGVVDIDRQKQSLLEAQLAEQSQLTNDRATLQANQSQVAGLKRQTEGKLSTAQAAIEQTLAVEGPKAAGLAKGVAIREGRVAQIRGQISSLGRVEDTIRSLDDRAAQLRAEVGALTERVSFTQTENVANAPKIQLIERATPPLVRSSPKMLLNTALGFVAGCALAGCLLLILGEAPARTEEQPLYGRRATDVTEEQSEAVEADAGEAPMSRLTKLRARFDRRPAEPTYDPIEPARSQPIGQPIRAPFATVGALALAADDEEGAVVAPQPVYNPEPVETPEPVAAVAQPALAIVPEPEALEDRIFGFVLPCPRRGTHYDAAEVRGIGAKVASWLGDALDSDRPLTVAATGDAADAQRLYQLIHDYRVAAGRPVLTIDWSIAETPIAGKAPKPLIYAAGGFGDTTCLAHPGGAVVVAIDATLPSAADLEAEARRLAAKAGRPVHVLAIGG